MLPPALLRPAMKCANFFLGNSRNNGWKYSRMSCCHLTKKKLLSKIQWAKWRIELCWNKSLVGKDRAETAESTSAKSNRTNQRSVLSREYLADSRGVCGHMQGSFPAASVMFAKREWMQGSSSPLYSDFLFDASLLVIGQRGKKEELILRFIILPLVHFWLAGPSMPNEATNFFGISS